MHPEVAALAGVRDAHRPGQEEPRGQHLQAAPEETTAQYYGSNYGVGGGSGGAEHNTTGSFSLGSHLELKNSTGRGFVK